MMGLTRAEADCEAFIRAFRAREGVMPSRREIAAGLNYRSTSMAARLVAGLVEKGRLYRVPRRARALALADVVHCPKCLHAFDPSAGRAQ
jgi:SOS-response transcriptional repressor LexA